MEWELNGGIEFDSVMLIVALAVGLNVTTGLIHGVVHEVIPVPLAPWQIAIVSLSIIIGPIVGIWLVAIGARRAGGVIITAMMALALGFEFLAHFIIPNPDFVGSIDRWTTLFTTTAWFSVATDVIGLIVGIWCWSMS